MTPHLFISQQHLNQRPQTFASCLTDKCNLGTYPPACSRLKAVSKLPQKAPDTPGVLDSKAFVPFLLSDTNQTLCFAFHCENPALGIPLHASWEEASRKAAT